jgi:hypothetical protein
MRRVLPLLLLLPVLGACSDAPLDPEPGATPELNRSAPARELAAGSWKLQMPYGQSYLDATYNARAVVKGLVLTGTWSADEHLAPEHYVTSGVVTCLGTEADGTARVAGLVLESSHPEFLGTWGIWQIRSIPGGDQASPMFHGYAEATALAFCNGDFGTTPLAMYPISRGDPNVVSADTRTVSFVYPAPATAPAVASANLAGTFNGWSMTAMPMTQRPDGSWWISLQLEAGVYEHKFVLNGDQWPWDMCYDPTWGDPADGFRVDPQVTTCVNDGFGGQNAQVTVP